MNRKEIADLLLSRRPELCQTTANAYVQDVFDIMREALMQRHTVKIRGVGTLYVATLSPRTAREPRNGTMMKVGARDTVRLRPARTLKKDLNAETES